MPDKNNLECWVGGGGEAANLLYLGYNIITSPQRSSTGHTLLVSDGGQNKVDRNTAFIL